MSKKNPPQPASGTLHSLRLDLTHSAIDQYGSLQRVASLSTLKTAGPSSSPRDPHYSKRHVYTIHRTVWRVKIIMLYSIRQKMELNSWQILNPVFYSLRQRYTSIRQTCLSFLVSDAIEGPISVQQLYGECSTTLCTRISIIELPDSYNFFDILLRVQRRPGSQRSWTFYRRTKILTNVKSL